MSTCNCDGSTSTIFQALPDAAYHVAGTTSPSEDAQNACAQAIAITRAAGLDPCDPANDVVLQANYLNALDEIAQVVQSEPLSNQLQKSVDVALGTSSPDALVVNNKPKSGSSSMTFLIGAIIVLAIGFVLLFH